MCLRLGSSDVAAPPLVKSVKFLGVKDRYLPVSETTLICYIRSMLPPRGQVRMPTLMAPLITSCGVMFNIRNCTIIWSPSYVHLAPIFCTARPMLV